jgi:hypothetical protein
MDGDKIKRDADIRYEWGSIHSRASLALQWAVNQAVVNQNIGEVDEFAK